jgi:hypothetical protein
MKRAPAATTALRHVAHVPSGDVDLPACLKQSGGGGPADEASASDDQCVAHYPHITVAAARARGTGPRRGALLTGTGPTLAAARAVA